MKILLVEDDADMSKALARALDKRGFQVTTCADGTHAFRQIREETNDLVILDLNIPNLDGLHILQRTRALSIGVPIIVLTARGAVGDRVAGLNAGADDYMTKPFEFPELEARLRAILRRARTSSAAAPADVALSGLHFDRAARRAVIHGEPVELSPREATLLELLLVHADKVVTKEQIATAWAGDGTEVGAGNTAEVHIHRLRRKLEGSGLEIRTVRGLGYLLAVERADGRPA